MGFGISDEVLEKIIMEPWLLPSEIGCGTVRYGTERPSKHGFIRTPPVEYPSNKPRRVADIVKVERPKTAATVKEQENVSFIKSVLFIVRDAFSNGLYGDLYSLEVKRLFDNIKEYFETVFSSLNIPTDSIAPSPAREKQSKEYLFHGIADQVFFLISRDDLDKIRFRNIVRDFIVLMRTWGIGETKEEIKKKAFFQYYAKEFGLVENRFHCCPYCGEKLYVGISNCPSCFKNIHEFAPHSSPATLLDESDAEKGSIDESNSENQLLREKLRIAQETIEKQKNALQYHAAHSIELEHKNAELQEANFEKEKTIKEKDQAIHRYRQHIVGIEEYESHHLKILVVGEFHLPEEETIELVENAGLSYDNLEFFDEYTKIRNLAARIKGDSRYAAIILGAIPHKVKNLDGASSLATLFQREGFPFTVEAKTYQGELKITRQSFQNALNRVSGNLLANPRLL